MTSSEGGAGASAGSHPGQQVRRALQAFLQAHGPRVALLVDRSGAILSAAGSPRGTDPLALASIASAHFNAAEQLASTLGEGEFTSLLHQGGSASLYLLDVAASAILVVLFEDLRDADRMALEGATVVAELEGPVGALLDGGGRDGEQGISAEWVRAAEEEIDRVFRERA